MSEGETIAVFGANGGVGGAAIQIAKHLGARVIGVYRGEPGNPTPAANLADILIDSRDPELGSVLRTHNAGRGADVVLKAAGARYSRSDSVCSRIAAGRWKLPLLASAA
ncbi:zinc-binding dehydrogenase [Edaphobacter modestus]|uniref:zinc-binding dehydrogenase n=1 Tax=Edaphobacter modestus TaxID=388466 RepID=UPI001A92CF62